jgi:hypothetical protein
MPSGIPKGKTTLTDEERKANRKAARKAAIKKYNESEKRKAATKEYSQSDKGKASRKKYSQSEQGKTMMKQYNESEKGKISRKKYKSSEKGKAALKEYSQSEQGKVSQKKYYSSEKGPQAMRLKVLQYYSKRLSNSDIPCCNCCGLNDYLEFLSLDHIPGRVEMNSISEVVKLGYKSTKKGNGLHKWIIDNNYLKDLQTEYFQILCHNCNFAKGHSKDGKCPHERK